MSESTWTVSSTGVMEALRMGAVGLKAMGVEAVGVAPGVRCCPSCTSMACLSSCCWDALACACCSSFTKCRVHQYRPSTSCLIFIKQGYRVIPGMPLSSCMHSFVVMCTLSSPVRMRRFVLFAQECNQQSMALLDTNVQAVCSQALACNVTGSSLCNIATSSCEQSERRHSLP